MATTKKDGMLSARVVESGRGDSPRDLVVVSQKWSVPTSPHAHV